MKKCNLVNNSYKETYVFDDNNFEYIKDKVQCFLCVIYLKYDNLIKEIVKILLEKEENVINTKWKNNVKDIEEKIKDIADTDIKNITDIKDIINNLIDKTDVNDMLKDITNSKNKLKNLMSTKNITNVEDDKIYKNNMLKFMMDEIENITEEFEETIEKYGEELNTRYTNELLVEIGNIIIPTKDEIKVFDKEFLFSSIKLLNAYEKIIMGNKYIYYNRENFWNKHKIVANQICKNSEEDLEKTITYLLNELIIDMFKDSSLSMSYPEYFNSISKKNIHSTFVDKYNNIFIDDLENIYREEFGNRYDDKFNDIN